MFNIKEYFAILDNIAPLSLSRKMIENGSYDNSGIIVDNTGVVNKALFSLDLSVLAVERAIELGCDTIVTHHPAIYTPIKSLHFNGENAGLIKAISSSMNVISMHLNLDIAKDGVDDSLTLALCGKELKAVNEICDDLGYGKEFSCDCSIDDIVDKIKKNLTTDKVIVYGQGRMKTVASFCGGGASEALDAVIKGRTCADLIVTSDAPHHVIKELIERGKKLILIPHYSAENYGFKKFYERAKNASSDGVIAYYFEDKRFI